MGFSTEAQAEIYETDPLAPKHHKTPTYAEAGLAKGDGISTLNEKSLQPSFEEMLARFAQSERENVELKATVEAQSSEITWLRSILAKQFV